jgi:hypothetical protein
MVTALGLTFQATNQVLLADGTFRSVNAYDAEVEWDGVWVAVLVTEIDSTPLIGTRLLIHHEMYVEFVPGGAMDITRLP